MKIIMNAFIGTLFLILALDVGASDNLSLVRYDSLKSLPSHYLSLLPPNVSSKTYKDSEGKLRIDKRYYVSTNSYSSRFKYDDIVKLANPTFGSLDSLLEETTIQNTTVKNMFKIVMVIDTPIKSFNVESTLTFIPASFTRKFVYLYKFSDFNMVFTDMTIQLEVIEDAGGTVKVKLTQVSAIKETTYHKLDTTPFAMRGFERGMKKNISKFKSGIGGI